MEKFKQGGDGAERKVNHNERCLKKSYSNILETKLKKIYFIL